MSASISGLTSFGHQMALFIFLDILNLVMLYEASPTHQITVFRYLKKFFFIYFFRYCFIYFFWCSLKHEIVNLQNKYASKDAKMIWK